jgi:hypothetical protein
MNESREPTAPTIHDLISLVPIFLILYLARPVPPPQLPFLPSLVAGSPTDGQVVFLAIMSTYFTYHRLSSMLAHLYSRPSFLLFIVLHIFIPPGPAPPPMPVPVTVIDSPADRLYGLCIRESAAMR